MFNVLLKNESIWKPFVEFISDNSLLYEVYKCLVSFVEKSVTCIKDELWFLRTPRWIICQHKNHRHAQLSGWKRYFENTNHFLSQISWSKNKSKSDIETTFRKTGYSQIVIAWYCLLSFHQFSNWNTCKLFSLWICCIYNFSK